MCVSTTDNEMLQETEADKGFRNGFLARLKHQLLSRRGSEYEDALFGEEAMRYRCILATEMCDDSALPPF
ncbi:hypothetical protein BDW22DRAFT_1358263 [Trametopsis cervina]|nr:hypothetical protein BDW22DRAFT_1358263 [Trametopsis cervina]